MTPLAEHVRECERCRAIARRLLAGQAELSGALDSLEPRHDVQVAMARARAAPSRRRFIPGPFAALAVAAALAAFWLVSKRDGVELEPRAVTAIAQAEEALPLVQAPPGKNVMVFETENPDIKVIWLY